MTSTQTTAQNIRTEELTAAIEDMTLAQAREWSAQHAKTVNSVIEGKGWEWSEQAVATASQAIIEESLRRGLQGRRVATLTVAAMIVESQHDGPEAWEA